MDNELMDLSYKAKNLDCIASSFQRHGSCVYMHRYESSTARCEATSEPPVRSGEKTKSPWHAQLVNAEQTRLQ